MEDRSRIPRVLLGVSLTVGLVAFGLVLTGTSVRAFDFLTTDNDKAAGGLPLVPGSTHTKTEMLFNGRPAEVSVCRTSESVKRVLAFYTNVAQSENAPGTPYLIQEGPGSASLMWVDAHGVTKAVLAGEDPEREGYTRYRLIVDQRDAPLNRDNDEPLPGGLGEVQGFTVRFSVGKRDGTGTVLLEAVDSPRQAASRMVTQLESRGFVVERERLGALEEHTDSTRVVVPFAHARGGLVGTLVVSPSPEGSRLCLTFREPL